MEILETQDGYFVVLSRGEAIIENLSKLVAEKNIGSGTLTGLGAVYDSRLGFYHLPEKKYDERLFKEEMELVSLMGNISWFSGKPVIHIHVTLGNPEFQAIAGHLFEAKVAVTAEIYLSKKGPRIERSYCELVGLNLQDLPKSQS